MNLDRSGEKTVEGPPLQYLSVDARLVQQQRVVENRECFALGVGVVCTENFIRVDDAPESPKLAE
jgi:hypothetical protein